MVCQVWISAETFRVFYFRVGCLTSIPLHFLQAKFLRHTGPCPRQGNSLAGYVPGPGHVSTLHMRHMREQTDVVLVLDESGQNLTSRRGLRPHERRSLSGWPCTRFPKANRPLNLSVSPIWPIFGQGSKRITFYFQVLWTTEPRMTDVSFVGNSQKVREGTCAIHCVPRSPAKPIRVAQ